MTRDSGRLLLDHHRALLTDSAIGPDEIAARGYWSATKAIELERLGYSRVQAKRSRARDPDPQHRR